MMNGKYLTKSYCTNSYVPFMSIINSVIETYVLVFNAVVKFLSMWIKLGGIKRDSCLIIIGGQIMVRNCHNFPSGC